MGSFEVGFGCMTQSCLTFLQTRSYSIEALDDSQSFPAETFRDTAFAYKIEKPSKLHIRHQYQNLIQKKSAIKYGLTGDCFEIFLRKIKTMYSGGLDRSDLSKFLGWMDSMLFVLYVHFFLYAVLHIEHTPPYKISTFWHCKQWKKSTYTNRVEARPKWVRFRRRSRSSQEGKKISVLNSDGRSTAMRGQRVTCWWVCWCKRDIYEQFFLQNIRKKIPWEQTENSLFVISFLRTAFPYFCTVNIYYLWLSLEFMLLSSVQIESAYFFRVRAL